MPTPAQFDAFVADIASVIERGGAGGISLSAEFRWLEPSAYQRARRGQSERSTGGDRPDVGNELSATDRVRGRLERAARDVQDARNRLLDAVAALGEARDLLDPPLGPEVADVRFLAHPADRGDVARARDAAARRMERAQRSGDWAEVTG